ncbi:hypothetical protein [Haloarchaeobius sp. DYHT-AS-18]|uniref:hypothetical protein n=1 Tax=Haloarchaeobius sp. DYHT-AS-18 TaxID=3446117 RepID=UPI003EB7FB5D
MVALDSHALDELFQRGRWLTFPDFVRLVEQDHPHDGSGVSREVLDAYAKAIENDLGGAAPFTVEEMEQRLERHLSDSDEWSKRAVYEVDQGHISFYPQSWHDRLAGETDPREYVALMQEDLAKATGKSGAAVPKQQLLNAMAILGGLDIHAATEAVDGMRKRGELLVYPFQNPEADVLLP